jgi:isocitrate lyase
MSYQAETKTAQALIEQNGAQWSAIKPESVARMRLQNKFKTGLDIAKYTAAIMRRDMAAFDADKTKYTQSLGCWHGFVGQQKLISIKKHFGTTERKYLYLSGWMVAALRSDFGPLPDQSMHEKTVVADLIEELYKFLRQADARELGVNWTLHALLATKLKPKKSKLRSITTKLTSYQSSLISTLVSVTKKPLTCWLRK